MKNRFDHSLFYWHIELSSKCALKCPRCPRTEFPNSYKVTEWSLDFFKLIFSEQFIKNEIDRFLFCGGQGDPIYCKDFLQIIKYIKSTKPQCRIDITTNGSHKTKKWWTDLKNLLNGYDFITFSIDGWNNESNNLYRVNSDFDSILDGMKIMSQSEAVSRTSTILFKFNQEHLKKIERVTQEAGVNEFDVVYSTLFGSNYDQYIDSNLGYDFLEPDKEFTSKDGRYERYFKVVNKKEQLFSESFLENKQKYFDVWNKQSSKLNVLPLCMTNNRGKYIDAEGILYPCSWVSHPFTTRTGKNSNRVIHREKSLWVEHRNKFDLNKNTLEEVLNNEIWNKLLKSWKKSDKCFIECENKCSTKEDYLRKSLVK